MHGLKLYYLFVIFKIFQVWKSQATNGRRMDRGVYFSPIHGGRFSLLLKTDGMFSNVCHQFSAACTLQNKNFKFCLEPYGTISWPSNVRFTFKLTLAKLADLENILYETELDKTPVFSSVSMLDRANLACLSSRFSLRSLKSSFFYKTG